MIVLVPTTCRAVFCAGPRLVAGTSPSRARQSELERLRRLNRISRHCPSPADRSNERDGHQRQQSSRQMRARARDLEELLRRHGVEISVQPVVVLWGRFEQRSILSRSVAWVQGNELQRALRGRPARLGADDIERASRAITDSLLA